ncbi:MAG: hypothetical protein J5646_08225 [Bacteroidales bacterium]|nr:hypothetical protein [Bacteroidales bacterium]
MSTQPTRQKFWPFLKSYLKRSLEVYKHPKQLLPTIILTVVWMVLGIVQLKVKENLPMQVLNFITYAQGGLYGGVVGAIGGILGKVVVAAFVNALIVPLFSGKKPFGSLGEGFKELGKQISFDSKETLAPLLKGLGAAMLIYILFNITARFENSMAGIMAAVSFALALGRKNGFMWDLAFSYANSVSKGKTPSYQNVLRGITGMSLGFALAVALGAVVPSLVSLLGIVALIVGWIMGKGSKKEAAATLSLLLLFTLSQQELRAQDEPSAVSSEGAWVLVDKKTTLSASSYDSGDYDAGNGVLNRVVIENVSGTVEQFEFDGDFISQTPRSWTGGTGYNEASHNKSHAEAAVTPFEGPYRPGEVFEAHYNGKVNGSAIMQIYSNIHLQIFLSYYPGESAMASWQFPNGDDQYWNFTFPTVEEAKGERFTISYRIELVEVVLQIDYIFEWGGRPEMTLGDFSDILWWAMGGEGEHAPVEWTIAIAIIGGFGGAIGAGLGGGLGGGTVPDGNGPLSPEEEEWLRWQKEAEDRRRRYLTDNPDGTRTMRDPATGKDYTLYPTYDEDGNQTGWKNENDTPYSEDSIDEWLGDRDRNSDYYSHNEYKGEKNLADQRAKNDARNAADAKRGSSKEADDYKAWKQALEAEGKRQDYMERVGNRYLVDGDLPKRETEIKKAIIRKQQDALREYGKQIMRQNQIAQAGAYVESVQKVCDVGITVGAQVVPGGKKVQAGYSLLKNGLSRAYEAHGKGGSFAAGLGVGTLEGGLEVAQNNVGDLVGKYGGGAAAKSGAQAGVGVVKEIFTGWYEGKDPKEIAKNVAKSTATEAAKLGVGQLTDKVTKFVNSGYNDTGFVYGSMYNDKIGGAIHQNVERAQAIKDGFETGVDAGSQYFDRVFDGKPDLD